MDNEQQHPDGQPQHQGGQPQYQGGAPEQQSYPPQQQPYQQPSQQSPYQQQGSLQPGQPQGYQQPGQQAPYQQQPHQQSLYQQQPAQQQPNRQQYGSSPAAPPAGWQGDQATYLQTVPTAVYQAPSQGGYPAYQQAPAPSAPRAASTTRSTWSLITGLVGLVVSIFVGWGFLLSIAAIVLGFGARRREPQGRGRALTGLVTGFVGLACSVGWLVYSVVVIIGYVST